MRTFGSQVLDADEDAVRVAGDSGTHGEVPEFLRRRGRAIDAGLLDLALPGGSPQTTIRLAGRVETGWTAAPAGIARTTGTLVSPPATMAGMVTTTTTIGRLLPGLP